MISFIKIKEDNYEVYINVNQITSVVAHSKSPDYSTICILEEEYTVKMNINKLMNEIAVGTTILEVTK